MVFASLVFLLGFLPLNLLLYFACRSVGCRNGVLIVFSLIFYAWGEPVWVSLLLLSATVDYFHGRIIERGRGTWRARAALLSSVLVNLGLLGFFKYGGMAVSTVNGLLGTSFPVPHYSLPIGISFYTFQTLSYVIDVYRGTVRAEDSYIRFLLFVSLFHQLVAGPIVRYGEMAADLRARSHSVERFSLGVTRFSQGLCKKVCLANVAGEMATPLLDGSIRDLTTPEAWLAIVLFSLQIYYDFSGYSDMAIGLGHMFGFTYPENFDHPYVARTVREFWRRWHMTLVSFFRDYVYIPLGGGRRHVYRNLLVVWALTGLWHGASWNFVIWGVYFALFMIAERAGLQRVLRRLPAWVSHVYLLLVVVVGWALFYYTDFERLGSFLAVLAGREGMGWDPGPVLRLMAPYALWFVAAVLFVTPVPARAFRSLTSRLSGWGDALEIAANGAMVALSLVFLVGGTYNPFLYFRF